MVSLMEDQIIQMQKLNVNAKMISSYSSKEDVKLLFQVLFLLLFIDILDDVMNHKYIYFILQLYPFFFTHFIKCLCYYYSYK